MRLFTAIDPSADLLPVLKRLMADLRMEAAIQWSPLDNLHVTTKFIGEWPDAGLERMDAVLQGMNFMKPISVELRGLGWYPAVDSPRVLFAGVDGGDALRALAARTDDALAELDIARETRVFSPHVTLARVKTTVSLKGLKAKVEERADAAIGTFQATQFHLYRSEPGSNSSIYRKLRTYPLQP